MSYNKAKAEKEWLKWKEAEEKKLRELGVDEDTIQRLHTYDWAQFNKERRFLQRWTDWSPYVEWISAKDLELPVEDTGSFLDDLENLELLQALSQIDPVTLQIAFLKIQNFSTEEICQRLGITPFAYYNRVKRLKQKIKKFLSATKNNLSHGL